MSDPRQAAMKQVAALVKQAQAIMEQAEAIAYEHDVYIDIAREIHYGNDVDNAWQSSSANC